MSNGSQQPPVAAPSGQAQAPPPEQTHPGQAEQAAQPQHAVQAPPPVQAALPGQVPPVAALGQQPGAARRLLWRAKKGAKPIVALWLTPNQGGCELSSDIYPVKSLRVDPVHAGPYYFRSTDDAQAFAQEAARALMHLGCEIVQDERQPQAPIPAAPAPPLAPSA